MEDLFYYSNITNSIRSFDQLVAVLGNAFVNFQLYNYFKAPQDSKEKMNGLDFHLNNLLFFTLKLKNKICNITILNFKVCTCYCP